MKNLKTHIREELLNIFRDECSYCGHELKITSQAEIEHIAPKGIARYTKFMFTEQNLGIACSYCNGFSKKGQFDTVASFDEEYSRCDFVIVHPYFDNPDDHYEWIDETVKILIIAKTEKGANSIKIFKLDDPKLAEARAKDKIFREYVLSHTQEELIDKIQSNLY
jgi:uncharacterized protein (TIGR02646 family)